MKISQLHRSKLLRPPAYRRWFGISILLLSSIFCGLDAEADCLSAPSGLVGFWPGDGNARDIVGTNNGTLNGGATSSATGVVGSAFSFNGTSSYVQIPDAPALKPTNFTIEAWVQFDAFASTMNAIGTQYLVFKKNTRGGDFEAFALAQLTNSSGQQVFHFVVIGTAGVPAQIDSISMVSTGVWYHVAAVRGSNFLQLYVNGVLETQTSVSFPQDYANTPLYFGTTGQAFDGKFKGRLDEVCLYNRALGSNEIAAIYLAGAAGKCKAPEITGPPQPQMISPGGSASFTVTATGLSPLKFQWRSNNVVIPGATTNTYTTPALQQAASGTQYRVVVTNTAGSITSAPALVTICTPGFPDNFDCRQTLVGSNTSVVATIGAATYEPNEPLHYVQSSSNSIWYTWTAPFSGGLVFQMQGTEYYYRPIVAIYTGTSLSNLVKLVANSQVENSAGSFPTAARAVTTVEAGQAYQIAVDGSAEFGGAGLFTNTLTLTPPPVNDTFAAATPIGGTFYAETGTFIGAGREAGEPSHGNATLGQTLWWKWIAPSNAPNPISTRLMTDAVNFPPAVGVYTGSVVAALSSISTTRRTNGMTSDVVFDAIPGRTYYIALAGRQSESNSVSPLIGNFNFRLNTRVLALSITNLVTSTNNSDLTVAFQANARIQNLGTNASGPLRISLVAASGFSTRQALTEPLNPGITNLGITNIATSLAAGQSMLVPIAGTLPAVSVGGATGIGHAAFADLQEQPVTNHWFTVDQALVTFGEWPNVGGIIGPGGGVIRFDPGYTASPFSPITAMAILGSPTITEGRITNYAGRVTFADTTTQTFTNTDWAVSRFTISTNGIFSAGSVTSNTSVMLTVPYYFSGITFMATTNVTVLNLPAPTLTNFALLGNAGLFFSVSGVPGRSHVIETATNLVSPVSWLPLATNASLSGVFTITNFSRTNVPVRFYRAREQ